MLTRALIVMLAVLNMGVALWWWLRPQVAPSLPTLAADVVVLELLPALTEPAQWIDTPITNTMPSATLEAPLSEDVLESQTQQADNDAAELIPDLDALPAELEAEAGIAENLELEPEISTSDTNITDITSVIALEEGPAQVPAEPEPVAPRCISLGPFTEMAQVQAALRALGSDVERFRLREVIVPANTRYRILIPPTESRAQAEAEVQRIAAAGFSDYFIINEGADTHAIALGQFRNQQGAQSRLAELKAAGFAAQLRTTVEVPHSNWWIDTIPIAPATPATLQQRSSAAQWQALDCARLR